MLMMMESNNNDHFAHSQHSLPYGMPQQSQHSSQQSPQQYEAWSDPTMSPPTTSTAADSSSNAAWASIPLQTAYQYPLQHQSQTRAQYGLQPIVTNQPWPSVLLSSQQYYPPSYQYTTPQSVQTSPQSATPTATSSSNATASTPSHQPTPRRTLTDADRRRMCEYHAENPTKKQTEIGEIFGVERSTVSKVLRHKDKYLNKSDASRSPTRKPKSKYPDIERTLVNWIKKQQEAGTNPTDDAIRKQARQFWMASGQSPELNAHISSPVWLDKFRQKYSIQPLKRGNSSNKSPPSGQKLEISTLKRPRSPSDATVSLNGASSQSMQRTQSSTSAFSVPRQVKSNDSMSSAYHPDAVVGDGGSNAQSPIQSPDVVGAGGFNASYFPGASRSRSQTYPSISNVDPLTSPQTTVSDSSQAAEYHQLAAMDTDMPPPSLSYRASDSIIQTPFTHQPLTTKPEIGHSPSIDSVPTPATPEQRQLNFEDARRGLRTALAYIQQNGTSAGESFINMQEFHTIRHIVERWGPPLVSNRALLPEGLTSRQRFQQQPHRSSSQTHSQSQWLQPATDAQGVPIDNEFDIKGSWAPATSSASASVSPNQSRRMSEQMSITMSRQQSQHQQAQDPDPSSQHQEDLPGGLHHLAVPEFAMHS